MPGRTRHYKHVGAHEDELIRQWVSDDMSATEIAALLKRDLSTVARRIKRLRTRKPPRRAGRPRLLSKVDEARVERTAERMIQQAGREWQVTASMVRKALKLKCCDRVILEALHRRGIRFHTMRQKPLLTTSDINDRAAFADQFVGKPVSFWQKTVHAYMDNKFFKTYLTKNARTYARMLRPRGTFRKPGQGLDRAHVKPPKHLKHNFGKSVQVSVAISASRVLTCHVIHGTWNKYSATNMYKSVLGPALRKAHPGKHRFLVLEDNDPTGYKSNMAKNAKQELDIDVLELPKRSPDLNPLEFSFWSQVNTRLRAQENKFRSGFTESRGQFIKRLRRTILRTPPQVLRKMVSNMRRRCELLRASAGQHFEEGS